MSEIHAMTGGEISNYRENMRRIEELMDHPVPPGLLSMEDLSRPLTSGEIAACRENIRRVEEFQISKKRRNKGFCKADSADGAGTEIAIAGGFILIGSFAAGEFCLIPLALIMLIPAFYKIYRYFKG